MTSVLYDAPGPVARRRELIGSLLATVVLLGLVGLGLSYAASRGLLSSDRWDVLFDPPRNQTAGDVWASLFNGLLATLRAAAIAAPLALALGLALALWRTTRFRVLRVPAIVAIELFRGPPVLLMMYFGLLALGLTAFQAVVFGLTVYNMAIFAEIIRAGIAGLPTGQREAAWATGLTRGQTMRSILLPQAIRNMLPSLVAQLVVLLKDSSLGFIVGYSELLRSIQLNAQYFGNEYFVALFVVGAGIFLVVNVALSWLARWLARRGQARGVQVADPVRIDTGSAGMGGAPFAPVVTGIRQERDGNI